MKKELLKISAIGLIAVLSIGCSTANKESVKVDKSTTKAIETVENTSKTEELSKAVQVTKVEQAPKAKELTKPVVKQTIAVKEKAVTKVSSVDPRDALEQRRNELAQMRLDTERSYNEHRR